MAAYPKTDIGGRQVLAGSCPCVTWLWMPALAELLPLTNKALFGATPDFRGPAEWTPRTVRAD